MVEVKVKVSIIDKKSKKKSRKPRKKTTKKPKFSTGSIDFKTIGTNTTRLAGLVASSRAVYPTLSQDNQLINELRKKEEQVTNNELVKQNIPPQPQFKPDMKQAQEETSPAGQVRRAMGNRIARQNNEIEDLEEVEAKLYIKNKFLERKNKQTEEEGKVIEAKNMMLGKELQINSQKLIESEGFLTKQKEDLIRGSNYLQRKGLEKVLMEQGESIDSTDDLTDLRVTYLRHQGLKLNEDYQLGIRERARGKASKEFNLIPIPKQDLRRAQEEIPVSAVPELMRGSSQEEREKRFTQPNLYLSESDSELRSSEEELLPPPQKSKTISTAVLPGSLLKKWLEEKQLEQKRLEQKRLEQKI